MFTLLGPHFETHLLKNHWTLYNFFNVYLYKKTFSTLFIDTLFSEKLLFTEILTNENIFFITNLLQVTSNNSVFRLVMFLG